MEKWERYRESTQRPSGHSFLIFKWPELARNTGQEQEANFNENHLMVKRNGNRGSALGWQSQGISESVRRETSESPCKRFPQVHASEGSNFDGSPDQCERGALSRAQGQVTCCCRDISLSIVSVPGRSSVIRFLSPMPSLHPCQQGSSF